MEGGRAVLSTGSIVDNNLGKPGTTDRVADKKDGYGWKKRTLVKAAYQGEAGGL